MTTQLRVVSHSQSQLFRASPNAYLIGVAVTIFSGLLPTFAAWCIAGLLGAIARGAPPEPWAAGVCLSLVLASFIPKLGEFCLSDLSRRLRTRMQIQFFERVNAVPGLTMFESSAFRDRMRMAQQASESSPTTLLGALTGTTQATIGIVSFLSLAIVQAPALSMLCVCSSIPVGWALSRDARERFALLWATTPSERRRAFYGSLLVNLQAIKELRIYGLGEVFARRMDKELATIVRNEHQQDLRSTVREGVTTTLGAIGIALAIWLMLVVGPQPSVEQASFLVAAFLGIQVATISLFERLGGLRQATNTYRTYIDLLSELPHPVSNTVHCLEPPLSFETIAFENVSFRYKDDLPWALQNVSISISRGGSYGVVGRNGAGKSTLVKLLLRLYEPTRGRILIDGVDASLISVVRYRQMVGAVFQDFMSYDLSLLENISIGDVTAPISLPAIEAAARTSGVDQIAGRLPRRWNTILTQQYEAYDAEGTEDMGPPVTLSGGQWQRVAIARAMMRRNRPLLVLDEPASGMDAKAEHELREALSITDSNQAIVHVSHRLSTIRRCNQIVVINDGHIVAAGTHEDLVAGGGEYAEMFHLQATGYSDASTK